MACRRRAGFSDEELVARLWASAQRLLQSSARSRSTTASASGSCSPRRTPAGASSASARGRWRDEPAAAKYLNTTDGELYHKREQLFGINLARPAAARAGRMVLVEGYTDVLALHQAGLRNSVGIMGTSLTEEQVARASSAIGAGARAVPRRRSRRAGGDAPRGPAGGSRFASFELARGPAAGGRRSRGPDRARRGPKALRSRKACHGDRRRSSSSPSSGSSITPTNWASAEGRTARSAI